MSIARIARRVSKVSRNFDGLPSTLTVRTPSGGRHFYFKTDAEIERPQHDIWPGIDLPRWVLIGGSHIDGVGNYRVEESDAVAQAPRWLLSVLVSPTLAKAYLTRRK